MLIRGFWTNAQFPRDEWETRKWRSIFDWRDIVLWWSFFNKRYVSTLAFLHVYSRGNFYTRVSKKSSWGRNCCWATEEYSMSIGLVLSRRAGASQRMMNVPTIEAIVKIHRKSLSRTIATKPQSWSSCPIRFKIPDYINEPQQQQTLLPIQK